MAPSSQTHESASPSTLASLISPNTPQYTFYAHTTSAASSPAVVFIYTCPTASKIKERMLYASSRSSIATLAANEAGITIKAKLEATDPSEITEQVILDEVDPGGKDQGRSEEASSKTFSRPKRPGRR